jgi:hypothetical protein
MSSRSIENFKAYIGTQNDDFLRNGKHVEGILRDIFPEEKSLISPLTCAWKAGVVTELRQTNHVEMMIAQLADKLCKEYALRESAAISAVRIWAYSLSVTNVVPNVNTSSVSYISQPSLSSETKKCPFCAEEVNKDALKCKHCNSSISNNTMDKGVQNEGSSLRSEFKTQLKKTSVIFMILMTIFTAGIYFPVWFLTRRSVINNLQSKMKLISKVLFFAALVTCISLLLSIISGLNEWRGEMDTAILLNDFSKTLDLIAWTILLVQSLKVRSILREHFQDYLKMDIKFSWLATFLFQIIYLQYKINKGFNSTLSASSPSQETNILLVKEKERKKEETKSMRRDILNKYNSFRESDLKKTFDVIIAQTKALHTDLPDFFWYKYEEEFKCDNFIKDYLKTYDKLTGLTFHEKRDIVNYRDHYLVKRLNISSWEFQKQIAVQVNDYAEKLWETLLRKYGDKSTIINSEIQKPITKVNRESYDIIRNIFELMKLRDQIQHSLDSICVYLEKEIPDEVEPGFLDEFRGAFDIGEIEKVLAPTVEQLFTHEELKILLKHCTKHKKILSKTTELSLSLKLQNTLVSKLSEHDERITKKIMNELSL